MSASTSPSESKADATHLWGRALEPLDRNRLAAGLLDARDRWFDWLNHRRHVMRIGVNHGAAIADDGDMALPENEIAALQLAQLTRLQRAAEARLLHVAVARAADPRRCQ